MLVKIDESGSGQCIESSKKKVHTKQKIKLKMVCI